MISGVTEWGIYVEIVENKCEGMIRIRDIKDDYYVFDEKNYALVGEVTKNDKNVTNLASNSTSGCGKHPQKLQSAGFGG